MPHLFLVFLLLNLSMYLFAAIEYQVLLVYTLKENNKYKLLKILQERVSSIPEVALSTTLNNHNEHFKTDTSENQAKFKRRKNNITKIFHLGRRKSKLNWRAISLSVFQIIFVNSILYHPNMFSNQYRKDLQQFWLLSYRDYYFIYCKFHLLIYFLFITINFYFFIV